MDPLTYSEHSCHSAAGQTWVINCHIVHVQSPRTGGPGVLYISCISSYMGKCDEYQPIIKMNRVPHLTKSGVTEWLLNPHFYGTPSSHSTCTACCCWCFIQGPVLVWLLIPNLVHCVHLPAPIMSCVANDTTALHPGSIPLIQLLAVTQSRLQLSLSLPRSPVFTELSLPF